jgi:hypothetical protein
MRLPLCAKSLPLVWLPEGLRRSEDYVTATHHRVVRILDLIQTDLLLQSRLDRRSQKKSSPTVCV